MRQSRVWQVNHKDVNTESKDAKQKLDCNVYNAMFTNTALEFAWGNE